MTYSKVTDIPVERFYKSSHYHSLDRAIYENDYVEICVVKNEGEIQFYEGFHSKVPDRKLYRRITEDTSTLGSLADNLLKSV